MSLFVRCFFEVVCVFADDSRALLSGFGFAGDGVGVCGDFDLVGVFGFDSVVGGVFSFGGDVGGVIRRGSGSRSRSESWLTLSFSVLKTNTRKILKSQVALESGKAARDLRRSKRD